MTQTTPSQGVYPAGQQTRRAILDAAATLFAERGLAAVSKAEIAERAGVLPSQLGYYFGTKEALFVESACREVLHLATAIETAASRTRTPRTYIRALVLGGLRSSALLFFAEAVLLVRAHPASQARVAETFDRLHREGERAVAESFVARGWNRQASAERDARAFWAILIGVTLEQVARGTQLAAKTAEETVDRVYSLYVGTDAGASAAGD